MIATPGRYVATRSRIRTYGYTVQDITGRTTYFIGPGCTCGWYKYKRDAIARAEVFNAASPTKELQP